MLRRCAYALLLLASIALGVPARVLASASGPGELRLISSQRLDPRLYALTFTTPALAGTTGVRLLLPAGYGEHPDRRYPVLYLLNGSLGNQTDWTEKGDAEALTAGLPLIVVMPNGGNGGYYSNWWNFGAGGPPEWETYHIDELVPWIDEHYRTIPIRGERAIAGLSMGGFGAFSYAARHPALLATAASFSGALDTNDPQPTGQPDESAFDGGPPDATWGPYQTEQIIWRAHDPWDLAENLRGLVLVMRTGNGDPGGPYPYNAATGVIESDIHQANLDMNAKLNALRIPHFFQDYGPGDHSWPYWQRDLKETLPQIMTAFAHPPPPPRTITFTAAEPSYEAYGWRVNVHRLAMEFSALENATARGFELTGSGSATVTTPPDYPPGRSYQVTTLLERKPPVRSVLIVPADRRLTIALPLGPPNPQAEYAPAAITHVYTTIVTIAPLPAGPATTRSRARRHHREARPHRQLDPSFTG